MASLFRRSRQNGKSESRRTRKHRNESRPAARQLRKFRLEALENRQLLSAVPSLPGAWHLEMLEECTTTCLVVDSSDEIATSDVVGGGGQADTEVGEPQTNLAPVAQDDAYSIRSNQHIGANVLKNDGDPEGDPLTVSLVTGAAHGQLQLGPDGRFTYIPDSGFDGEDSFVYQVSDGQADSGQATVRIQVARSVAANAVPSAADDNYTVAEDGSLVVEASGVLGNDTDLDGDSLSAVIVSPPRFGTVILGTDGSLEYTPDADFHGTDSFTYLASDGNAQSQEATVTIEVTPVNDLPVAVDDSYTMDEDGVLIVGETGVLGNDTDADGDPLTAVVVEGPSHGSLTLNPDGTLQYTPEANYSGEDQFTYVADDGQGESDPATVLISIAAINDVPVAADDAYSVNAGETLVVAENGVLSNDSDVEGSPLSAVVVNGPSNGSLTLNPDGTFEYTPMADFSGEDHFTYVAADGETQSEPATVTITVVQVNAAPVAADNEYSVEAGQTLAVSDGGVLADDSDADGDPLTAILVDGPSHGQILLKTDGTFEYAPAEGFTGTDSFTYRASDGQAESEAATVTIEVVRGNEGPQAEADSYGTNAGVVLTISENGVLTNDADADGDPLTATLVEGPAHGTLNLNPDGSFEYTPAEGFLGTDSFTYVANDGTADSDLATVTITVEAVEPENLPPAAQNDEYRLTSGETLSITEGGVLANDSDPDSDPLSAVVVEGPSHGSLTLNPDGSFQYTPEAGYRGTDSFTYVASDGESESEAATVSISVEHTTMRIHLEVSEAAFGAETGPIWSGSTFWVNVYVEDLRELPQGVVGGAVDLLFDTLALAPTGNMAYGEAFSVFQQGTADDAAGLVDEAGALATTGGVGVDGPAAFMAWEFRRDGVGAPDDPNSRVTFSVAPAQGDGTITPGNFALVGQGTGVDWSTVEMGTTQVDLFLGDFNADGYVNHFDLALFIPQNPTAAGDAGYSPKFDLTADSAVDQLDLDLLLSRMYEPVMPAGEASVVEGEELVTDDLNWAASRIFRGADQKDLDPEFASVDLAFDGQDFWKDV